MEIEKLKEKFDEDLLIEAEIFSNWVPFFGLGKSNHKIFSLTQSIIFKLHQSHYHLDQALHYSGLSIKELNNQNFKDRKYYNFVTNCNIDSMMYALNSVMDIIAKLIAEIYCEVYNEINFKKIYFKTLNAEKYLCPLKQTDPNTAGIIQAFSFLEVREYVRRYCNENKHQIAFFSAGSYFDVNIDNDLEKVEIIKGYNLKNRYKRSKVDKELSDYAPKIFNAHLEKICELGKSILNYKGLKPLPVDENILKYLERMSVRYYR